MTRDILRFTRPAAPGLQVVEVDHWLEDLRAEMSPIVGENVEIRIADGQKNLLLFCDPLQILQVFSNLILNARDAMVAGGVITIGVRGPSPEVVYPFGIVEDPSRRVHLTVSDDGGGIPPALLQHIFEPLFSTKSFGTGLGLAVVHQIVQQHRGQIFVESEVGKGTTFHLFLPIADAVNRPAQSENNEEAPGSGRKVLIVEDDPLVASGLADLLELDDFATEIVEKAELVLEVIERFGPDAVLLDLHLAGKDGLDVYREIAARWPLLPVIFSTGHGDETALEEILSRPTVGFLLKPYASDEMLAELKRVWQSSQDRVLSGS